MPKSLHRFTPGLAAGCLFLLLSGVGGCVKPQSTPVPTPTKTPRPVYGTAIAIPTAFLPELPSATPLAVEARPPAATEPASPTDTPAAVVTEPAPTASATLPPSAAPAPSATPLSQQPTPTLPATRLPQPAPAATLPPRRGGNWDLEEGFYAWQSPHEGFTAFVANGWLPLSKVYDPAAPPRLNENKYVPNIHSGERSQEVSFDWRSGEAGIFRTVEVVPGHRYVVQAWTKYVPSESGLAVYLGIDLGGSDNFAAGAATPCSMTSA